MCVWIIGISPLLLQALSNHLFRLSPLPKVSALFCLSPNIGCRKVQLHRPCRVDAMEDDWDLHAVVRGCTASAGTATSAVPHISGSFGADFRLQSRFSSLGREQVGHLLSLPVPDPFETRIGNGLGDLDELYKPFFRKSEPLYPPQSVPASSLSSLLSVSHEQSVSVQPKQRAQQQPKQSRPVGSVTSSATSNAPRSKKRKNQLKKVCQVPAEALSSDVWAWRKYGQKPIKGSPYPRGYYRCSSSKGCMARKQVERNKSDPGMFTVTFTGEHNHLAPTHRNSLAGSTRQKTVPPQTVTASDSINPSPSKPACSSPATSLVEDEPLPQSTNTGSREDIDFLEDEEEDELCGFSEMAASNDFFAGLEEELPGSVTADRFSDHFAPSFGHPWLANNAATAAGGF